MLNVNHKLNSFIQSPKDNNWYPWKTKVPSIPTSTTLYSNTLTSKVFIPSSVIKINSWTSHHWSDEILGNRLLSKPFLPSYPRSSCGSFLFLANWLICLASIYWWMHLHLCHDLNGILDRSILLLLNLLFLHSCIRNNDRFGCSHRMYPLSWQPFHTTRL